MREKNGKEARPKFHVMFPIAPCSNAAEYAAMKQAVQRMFPFFDGQALDAARFFFGTEEPEVEYWEGVRDLTGFLEKRGFSSPRGECIASARGSTCCVALGALSELDNEKISPGREKMPELNSSVNYPLSIDNYSRIPQGQRNNTMHRFALKTLKRYGKTEKALQLYLKDAERCDPPLPTDELRNTWYSAVKFYEHTIAQAPDYIPPEEYGRTPAALSLKPPDYSDIGQAKVLVREYADELCYTESTDYLRYDGRCWRESKQRAVGAVEEFLDLQLADAEDEIASAVKELTDIGGVEFDLSDGTRGLSRQFKAFDDEEKLQALERAKEKLASAFLYKAFAMKRRD
ncbi:MAG: primase C-terminal domain-containing protein, partial [Oscillospiraceae bacterium]|nr:primase C-terminal domain-containing protein [Oscillospiraceae bacterium]